MSVETGKGLKKAANTEECKVIISSLKKEDRSISTDRDQSLEGCTDFDQKLYEDIAKTEA